MNKHIPTPTVGEVLVEDFMTPLNISVVTLADSIGLSVVYVRAFLNGEVKVTPELFKRLADYFGMSELFFYRLQKDIDSRNARVNLETVDDTVQQLALA